MPPDTAPAAAAPERFATRAELEARLPAILGAPRAEGRVALIVVRPEPGQRTTPAEAWLSRAAGVEGDHWAKGCWMADEAGRPHPDVQVCMMGARTIGAIAGAPANWAAAGDNLVLDFDLTPAHCPPGTRLSIGGAELVVTAVPHNGCQGFIDRFGRDACRFVNTGAGREHRLRGIYGRVTRDGIVRLGDRVRKTG